MATRRDLLKAGAACGGLAAFAVGFAETGERIATEWFGEKKTKGVFGNSLEPEYRISEGGGLEINPRQQVSFAMCMGCTTYCSVRVRIDKESQTVKRVAGNPFSPLSADPHLPYGTSIKDSFLGLSGFREKGLAGRSTACGRGNAVLEQMTSPYRLTQPLKRVGPRNSGRWQTISFEQLVKEVVDGGDLFGEGHVDGLMALRDLHAPIDPDRPELGPKVNQVAYLGSANDGREAFARRFMQSSFGTINFTGHGSFCGGAYRAGSGAVFGDMKRMPHAKPDLQHAEFIIFIGTAPGHAGNPFKRQGTLLAKARTDGVADYVVIDPVLTHADNRAVADRARWIPIKPGGDGALAMAMIRWIIENERYDAKFLAQPNRPAAEAAGEASWCNATHLVINEPDHPRFGFFLRASDLGDAIPENDRHKDADAFVVVDQHSGALVPHDRAAGPAQLFVDHDFELAGSRVRLRSSLDLLRESAQAHDLTEYASACGIPVATIIGLAKEFTSHGKKAAVNTHGGTMAGNGFYNAFALVSLNSLIGNLNWKGGTIVNAGGFKEEEGPCYRLAEFAGKVKPSGVPLSRNVPYEKTTEYRLKKGAGKGYPAEQPWFSTVGQLSTEWLPSALNAYPYALKALILSSCNPVYGIPGAGALAPLGLGNPNVIPLVIAIDPFINESTAYADYIVPDSGMYECWGFATAWGGVPTKNSNVRWPVIEPRQAKTAEGHPIALESFFIALAKRMDLPGFGANAGQDGEGKSFAIDWAEDYYLRAAANVAFQGKEPVPDASDEDILLSGVMRIMPSMEERLKESERDKVAYMLARGGRFQDAGEAFHGDWATARFVKPLQIYHEALGTARNALNGSRYSGVPVWIAPQFADGTAVGSVYGEADWPFQLISFKSSLQNSYSIAIRSLRSLHPENPVAVNRTDATRLGIATGDRIRLVTPGGSAETVAIVRDGVMSGVVAVEHGFGHKEHGARAHVIGDHTVPAGAGIGGGINLNDLGLTDPSRKGRSLFVDSVSGTAVRQGIPARIEKV